LDGQTITSLALILEWMSSLATETLL
jgi:hypothetical protein